MASPGDEAVDNIEKHGLKQASQYEYFMDTWQEWNRVADQIPYKSSSMPMRFVSDTATSRPPMEALHISCIYRNISVLAPGCLMSMRVGRYQDTP